MISSRIASSPVVLHVVRRREGQPEQIVGTPGASSLTGRLVPPVLHVSLEELARGCMEQMGTQEVGPREAERHRILKLIAEAERSARLVEGGSGPEPATEVLVHQPAVHQHVE